MMEKMQRDEENNTKFRKSPPHQTELEGLLPRNMYVGDTMENRVYSPVRKEPAGLYAESMVPLSDSAIDRGTVYSNSEVFDSLEKLRAEIEALRASVCARVKEREDRVYETIDTKHRRKKPEINPSNNRVVQSAKDTGFHRLRYIIDPNINGMKRVLWVILFICAVGATVYQIRDRVLTYTRYPSNVNIDVDYLESLSFPAVTICNENENKLTDQVRSGFFGLVSALGHGKRVNNTAAIIGSVPHSANTTYSSYLRAVSHQKEDLINTCVWNNQPCSFDNFTEVFTDHGLCYRFVPHPDRRETYRSGPMAGLFLILNAEQYEYTTDSKSAVGIKFAVHDDADTPWLREHGINAAVGTHTSVGLKKIVHENLPSPHGRCSESRRSSYTRDVCLRKCDSEKIKKRCKCLLPGLEDYPIDPPRECSVADMFACVQYVKGHADGKEGRCDCSPDCTNVGYSPTLSHAATSVYAGESIVRRFAKGKQLAQRLKTARDMQQRVDIDMLKYDTDMLSNISNGLDVSYKKLEWFCTFMMESYKEEYDAKLSELQTTLETLNKTIRENHNSFMDSSHIAFFSSVNHFRDKFSTVTNTAMEARSSKIKSTAKLNETAWKLLRQIEPLIKPAKDFWPQTESMLSRILRGVEKFRKDLVQGDGQRYEQFKERQMFYNETTLMIMNQTQDLAKTLTYEYERVKNITTKSHRRADGLIERAINNFLQDLHKLAYLTVPTLNFHLTKLYKEYMKDRDAIVGLATDLVIIGQTFPSNISNIDNYLSAIKSTLSTLRDVTFNLKGELSKIALEYERDDIDKTYMASMFDSNAIRSSLEKLRSSFRHLTSRFDNLMKAGISVRNVINPVENGTKKVEFDLVWLDFPSLEREAGIIKGYLERIVSSVTDYQNNLKEYLKGNKLDENFYVNNFLHLEIYFSDLSVTRITQQQSYSMFDLSCDIGGTLALYMGICILTIFEAVDFIVNTVFCPSPINHL